MKVEVSGSSVPGLGLLETGGVGFGFLLTANEMFELAVSLIRVADKLEELKDEGRGVEVEGSREGIVGGERA